MLIKEYIKDHRYILLMAFFCLLIGWGMLTLYNVEREAILYTIVLIIVMMLLYILVDYRRYKKQHEQMKQILNSYMITEWFPNSTLLQRDMLTILELLEKERRKDMENYDRQKDQLQDYFSLWAHQIKLPIAALKLLLEDEDIDRSECRTQLHRIDTYSNMAMAYLRLNSLQTDYLVKELALDPLIRQCIRSFSGECIRKKIRMQFTETNQTVISDEKWLGFVLEQLLSNAIKYSEYKGLIEIYMEQNTLVIQDHGRGIDAADLHRVFEKGFTGANGRIETSASGIGLYLCKQITDRLHHTLTIESDIGQGTKVMVGLERIQYRLE